MSGWCAIVSLLLLILGVYGQYSGMADMKEVEEFAKTQGCYTLYSMDYGENDMDVVCGDDRWTYREYARKFYNN